MCEISVEKEKEYHAAAGEDHFYLVKRPVWTPTT
jgi:hypothetical protein